MYIYIYIYTHVITYMQCSWKGQTNSRQELAKGTRLVRAVDVANIEASGEQTSWMRHKRSTVGKVAADRAKAGRRVAVVSAASAYHAGGGFNAGGRHALEEALCMQSTLYLSLERAAELASAQGVPSPAAADPPRRRDGEPWRCHIPRDGVVLSPHVEFFRGDTSEGYPFSPQTFEATVVSVAMPNCAPNLEDAPVDVPNALEYEALLGQKFAALLGAAALEGADCLVMPDAGCGVYMNRPEEVGRAFGEAVRRRCPEAFAEIHLVVKERRNYNDDNNNNDNNDNNSAPKGGRHSTIFVNPR